MSNEASRRRARRTRQTPAVNTSFVGLKLPASLLNKVDKIAADANVTRSEIVRRAVAEFNPSQENEHA